jgi:putative nucleotidyltransferase with HDIG domain
MIDIEEIVRKIEFLPPIPISLFKVTRLLNQPNVQVDSVVEMIQYDPSLSANILKMCQSPFYSMGANIDSLQQAVIRIGFRELQKMVMLIASTKVIGKYYPGYEDRKGELWRHSMASAIIAEKLQAYAPETGGDLFTAALLHDVGKMVLSEYVGSGYAEIEGAVTGKKMTFNEAESAVFGTTHAEVGAMILEKWGFHENMVKAVRYHHQPDLAPDSPLTHFVALSDTISLITGFNTEMDGMNYRGFGDIYRKYGISEKNIEKIMAESLDKISEVEAMFQ